MNTIVEIAKELWAPAKQLSKEGLSYHHYLTEFSWLLLLKLAPIYGVTTRYSWDILVSQKGIKQYHYYQEALAKLQQVNDKHIATILMQARTALTRPEQLTQMVTALTVVDKVPIDDLGELYECLLEQYAREESCHWLMPPRSLIDTMVILTQPQPGELIADPLAGTARFLVAADQYIQVVSEDLEADSSESWEEQPWLLGMEQNLEQQRLALMNCLLHNIQYVNRLPVQWGDSLVADNSSWPPADVIFSMLVFANEAIDNFSKPDASLAWLQQIFHSLKPGGRAAVIVPDWLCTAPGPAQQVRRMLLETCVVHTVLRLPLGTFYPHKIAAQVLFFRRGQQPLEPTEVTWFYDARSRFPTVVPYFRLTRNHLKPFELAYGDDPLGQLPRQEKPGYWRSFTRQMLATYQDQLAWDGLIAESAPVKRHLEEERWGILETAVAELEALSMLLR